MPPKKTNKQQKLVKQEQPQKQPNKIEQKQKQKQNQWVTIENLNKLYKVDRILLKHAYDHYPQLQILQNSNQYRNVQKFYRYALDNLFKIEKHYLMDDVNIGEGFIQTNYNINKNSTSKFIRDEKQHYNIVFKKHAEKTNQQQYGINGTKLYDFAKQCFQTKFTRVLIKGQQYFQKDTHISQFEKTIKQFYCNTNGINEDVYRIQNVWLSNEQILDFLTYWLKYNEDNQFYILYCRTEEKLKKDMHYLKTQAQKNKIKQSKGQKIQGTYHPITLKDEQVRQIQQQIIQIQKKNKKQEIKQEIKQQIDQQKIQSKSIIKIPSVLQRFRRDRFFIEQPKSMQKVKVLTKKQQLMLKLSKLFIFGCKRRYPVTKGTTFDQIQQQSKTMNLQKFMNFCQYFEINKFLSKQLLTQIFKINAINRLTIDQPRFVKVIQTIIKTDENSIDNFLNKKYVQTKLKSEAKLSNYKFTLIPIKGKNLETLQNQIQQKKILKQKEKQQRLNMYYLKKQKEKQRGVYKKQKVVNSSKLLPQFTNIIQLQNMRDDNFDPKKFIGNDHDELLSQYQSKIQSLKDFATIPSSLQTILSRRLQKGNKIIQKINSSAIRNYQ